MTDQLEETHHDIVHRFGRMYRKDRLAHAYIFVGPSHIGKAAAATAIAKMLQCERNREREHNEPCGICPSCLKIDTGNHPDVHVVSAPFGEKIKIEQARELMEQSRLRPFMSQKKVFIVRDIDRMTIEATNALLKTLEEPTSSSLLILTSSLPEKVLDTVRSRCHQIFFKPASQEILAESLRTYYHDQPQQAHFLAYFAEGCPGTARQLHEQGFFDKKNDIIERFIFTRETEAFLKGTLSDKQETRDFLGVLLSWIRDAMMLKMHVPESMLIHADCVKELKQFTAHHSFEDLREMFAEVVHMSRMLAENLNLKIPLLIIKEKLWVSSFR